MASYDLSDDCQATSSTSSTRILNPHSLSVQASYDVATPISGRPYLAERTTAGVGHRAFGIWLVTMRGVRQGLTLVHFSAQPEPFLMQNTPYIPPLNP
jgi:hypothetical protein